MNRRELAEKVHAAMKRQCASRGYATAVDVLMEIGMLSKVRYEDWRFGRVLYLEQVCEGGLGKLAAVLREMRSYADSQNLKPSWCCYKRWDVQKKTGQGKRPAVRLRFSKSGDPAIEEKYATHYVDRERIAALKAAEDSRIVPDL